MNHHIKQPHKQHRRTPKRTLMIVLLPLLIAGCAVNPHNVDITMNEGAPSQKVTNFQQAMFDLGLMSEIYNVDKVNVMSQFISDNTGTSVATKSEIPRDVTEMVKSTLNGFGGKITYIPYDPDFILNSAQTGYSGFTKKLIPHVFITGGITEFDRGLETRGKNIDIGLEGTLDDNELGFDFSNKTKTSVASITLDFNMMDFETMAGIPRMQAVNNIKVRKALAENSMAFSVIGNTLGLKGTVKKVQGRHAAVRLLVQVSMIELLGKYLNLPYWRLLGTEPDPMVLGNITRKFYAMTKSERIAAVQRLLILNGYSVPLTGQAGKKTQDALLAYGAANRDSIASPEINEETYLSLYSAVPVTEKTLQKQRLMANHQVDCNGIGCEALKESGNDYTFLSTDGLLRITTNETTFDIGDQIIFSVEVTKPLYVRVFNISSTGEIGHLFPPEDGANQRLTPGRNYPIPPESASYELEIVGPSGMDQLIAIGSTRPIPDTISRASFKNELPADLLASALIRVETKIHIR